MQDEKAHVNELSRRQADAHAATVVGPATAGATGAGSRTRWQNFRLIFRVIEIRLRFIAILVAIAFFVGYWDTIRNHWEKQTRPDGPVYGAVRALFGESTAQRIWPHSTGDGADSDTEYYCPMHPSVVRPTLDPNGAMPKCPICG